MPDDDDRLHRPRRTAVVRLRKADGKANHYIHGAAILNPDGTPVAFFCDGGDVYTNPVRVEDDERPFYDDEDDRSVWEYRWVGERATDADGLAAAITLTSGDDPGPSPERSEAMLFTDDRMAWLWSRLGWVSANDEGYGSLMAVGMAHAIAGLNPRIGAAFPWARSRADFYRGWLFGRELVSVLDYEGHYEDQDPRGWIDGWRNDKESKDA